MLSSGHHNFIDIFRDSVLAWAKGGECNTVLALPPFHGVEESAVRPKKTPLLKVKRGRRPVGNLIGWPRQGVHAKPNPFVACVLEGEADLTVGVTDVIARNLPFENPQGIYNVRLRKKEILVHLPHVPTSDGQQNHWCDPAEPPPDSTILWVDVFAEGAILHTCHTVKGQHRLGTTRFVLNPRLQLTMQAILEELQSRGPVAPTSAMSEEIIDAMLHILFLRIARSLCEQSSHKAAFSMGELQSLSAAPTHAIADSGVVSRSCYYIQGRLSQRLTVRNIAEHAFVSPAQLNRLFRAELNQSVMSYVARQRLNMAKELLLNTTLPINIIGENVGIANPVYFSRMFRRATALTPSEFRRNRR